MAYAYGNPRYGVSVTFTDAGADSGNTKTINYLNLAVEEGTSGYTPTQLQAFIAMIATATNKETSNLRMTAERPLTETEDGGGD